MPSQQIRAFVNLSSGSGEAAREALEGVGVFDVAPCVPDHLDRQIERAVREGAERVVVAGGDGTIAMAAAALVRPIAAFTCNMIRALITASFHPEITDAGAAMPPFSGEWRRKGGERRA